MELIHFCSEATKDNDSINHAYTTLLKYNNNDLLNIQVVRINEDTWMMSGTMWCEDAGLPPMELSYAFDDIKFRIIEPFYIEDN